MKLQAFMGQDASCGTQAAADANTNNRIIRVRQSLHLIERLHQPHIYIVSYIYPSPIHDEHSHTLVTKCRLQVAATVAASFAQNIQICDCTCPCLDIGASPASETGVQYGTVTILQLQLHIL